MTRINKTYLGDGAFAEYDGFSVILTTSDGVNTTNEIHLEPDMVAKIGPYLERSRERAERMVGNRTCNQDGCDADSAHAHLAWRPARRHLREARARR